MPWGVGGPWVQAPRGEGRRPPPAPCLSGAGHLPLVLPILI